MALPLHNLPELTDVELALYIGSSSDDTPKLGRLNATNKLPDVQLASGFDFISAYADYADVYRAPREAHEAMAISYIATILNKNGVTVKNGPIEIPLDFWLLLLSDSSMGRNLLIGTARPVLAASRLSNLERSGTWASRQALYASFAKRPTGLIVWSEISAALQTLSQREYKGTKEWLADRFDEWRPPDPAEARTKGKLITFDVAPRINILSSSSYSWLFNSAEHHDAAGGLLPRYFMLGLTPKANEADAAFATPPDMDMSKVPALAAYLRQLDRLRGQSVLSASPGAQQLFRSWWTAAYERFMQQANIELAKPFFSRLQAYVLKLALVYQVSTHLDLHISDAAMQRAILMAGKAEATIFTLLPTGMSKTGGEIQSIYKRILHGKSEGIPQSELTRAFWHLERYKREGHITTLKESAQVFMFSHKNGKGRPSFVYVADPFVQDYIQKYPEDTAF